MKQKLIILQPILAHYRKSVYTFISDSDDFDVFFMAGNKYKNIKSYHPDNSILYNYASVKTISHTFFYLKGSLRSIRKIKPDIIISSGIDFHLLHSVFIFLIHKMLYKRKFYWWSHATTGNQGKLGSRLRMFFYKNSDGVLTYSKEGQDTLHRFGMSKDKTCILGNALNIEDYGFRMEFERKTKKPDHLTVLFSGRISKSRRLDLLFRAIAQIKDHSKIKIHGLIVGGGNINELKQLAVEFNVIDSIDFKGELYGEEAGKCFSQSDLVVFPKAIGISLLHAYSYGIPAITTDNLEIQMPEIELLIPGETGDFYKDEDVTDLVKKILKWNTLLNNSEDTIHERCLNRIMEMEYTPWQVADKLLDFISH